MKKFSKIPRVVVLMTVYNDIKNISQSIKSILSQSYKKFKFVIIDDGSTDGTKKIIKNFKLLDKRIHFINFKKNKGPMFTRNFFLKNFDYDYCIIQDSDDISKKNRLDLLIKFMEKNPNVGVCGSYLEILDDNNKFLGRRLYELEDKKIRNGFFSSCAVSFPSIIFRKKAVEKIKFNKKYYPAEDLDFLIKIGKNFNYGNLSYYLIKYKQRIDSLTNSKMSLMEKASLKIRFKLFFNKKFKKKFINIVQYILFLMAYYFISKKIKIFLFNKIRIK